MLKVALTALVVVFASATTASAQGSMVCGTEFKNIWDQLKPNGPAAKMSGEQLANVHRTSLRAYDACMSGDESWAKAAFDKIGQQLKKNER
jgi:DNA-binding FadR family transcriptional regulator